MDIEHGFMRKSGARGAWVVFLCLKSLGIDSLKVISSRDLNGIVQHPISQNVVLDFTFGRY